jgi:ATP-dependent RNA helicase DDX55/SPB4
MRGQKFSALGLTSETVAVLKAQGFRRATPVQEATIPMFAGNKDVAVDAATGSGKTLAFIIPIIEKMRRLDHRLKQHQVRSKRCTSAPPALLGPPALAEP